jgi:hypothetical protein
MNDYTLIFNKKKKKKKQKTLHEADIPNAVRQK